MNLREGAKSQQDEVSIQEQQEYEAAYVVDHTVTADLPSGFSILDPRHDESYIVIGKLSNTGEDRTYLTETKTGKKKVVKLVSVGNSVTSNLEEKLNQEYWSVNSALKTNITAFVANLQDIAIVHDYVEGPNLRQEIETVDSVLNETQVVDFLLQITKNYLQPLHENDVVHKNIKPQNIICSTENEQRKYTLIDFDLLWQVNPQPQITNTPSGTPGYTKIKTDYECADDYYSLAKTAYFLFTGKDPEYVGHPKYDALQDQEIFGALKINDNLKTVLFRMLGHEQKNRYQSSDDLIADLEKLKSKVSKNKAVGAEEIGVDLKSAQILTEHREARQLPLSLQRNINGLKQRFKEQYEGTLASRVDLEKDFVSDLEETLYSLGYKKQGIVSVAQEDPFKGMTTYLRQHHDSKNIDVLLVNLTSQGEHHLKYCKAESLEEAAKLFSSYQNTQTYYTIPKRFAMWASTLGAITYGALLGSHWNGGAAVGLGIVGLLTAYIAAQVNYKNPLYGGPDCWSSPYYAPIHRMDESNSFWWGLLGLPLPHSVGKLSYKVGNYFAKGSHDGGTDKNLKALEEALQPAAHFIYKKIENS